VSILQELRVVHLGNQVVRVADLAARHIPLWCPFTLGPPYSYRACVSVGGVLSEAALTDRGKSLHFLRSPFLYHQQGCLCCLCLLSCWLAELGRVCALWVGFSRTKRRFSQTGQEIMHVMCCPHRVYHLVSCSKLCG